MAKWIFALLVFLSAGAQADGYAQYSSGCVVFNEIIYEEVTASGWGMTGADLVFTNFREPGVVVCTGATRPASAEMTRALRTVSDGTTRQSDDSRRSGSAGSAGQVDSQLRNPE